MHDAYLTSKPCRAFWWLASTWICLALATGCQSSDSKELPLWGPMSAGKSRSNEGSMKFSPQQKADFGFAMGRQLEEKGDFEGALDAYLKAGKFNPERGDIALRTAICYDSLGKFEKSAPFYQKALELSHGDPLVFCNRGYSLYLQRRWQESEASLRQALALKPDLEQAHNNLGLLLARTDRVDQAVAAFARGGCNEAEAHTNIATALLLESNLEAAHQHYALANNADPKFQSAIEGMQRVETLIARVEKRSQLRWHKPQQTPAPHPAEQEQLATQESVPAPQVEPTAPAQEVAPQVASVPNQPKPSVRQASTQGPEPSEVIRISHQVGKQSDPAAANPLLEDSTPSAPQESESKRSEGKILASPGSSKVQEESSQMELNFIPAALGRDRLKTDPR